MPDLTPEEHAARIREALDWQSSLGAPAWTTAGRTVTAALEALSTLEAEAVRAQELAARDRGAAVPGHGVAKTWHGGGSVVGALCECGWEGTVWDHFAHGVEALAAERDAALARAEELAEKARFADSNQDMMEAYRHEAILMAARVRELEQALQEAFVAGFNASGEGFNGEYPFRDHADDPALSETVMAAYSEWLPPRLGQRGTGAGTDQPETGDAA